MELERLRLEQLMEKRAGELREWERKKGEAEATLALLERQLAAAEHHSRAMNSQMQAEHNGSSSGTWLEQRERQERQERRHRQLQVHGCTLANDPAAHPYQRSPSRSPSRSRAAVGTPDKLLPDAPLHRQCRRKGHHALH